MFCEYYQAEVLKEKTWFISGCFRNEENFVFARALEGNTSVFEFFVPPLYEDRFLAFSQYFLKEGYFLSLEKKENRLKS